MVRGDHQLVGHPAMTAGADHAIARLEARYPGPDGCNRAGDLAAWRKRTWWLELIAVLNDEQIRVVDAAGLDRQQDLAGAGRRVWHLLQHQRFRSPHALAQHRLHRLSTPANRLASVTETHGRVDAVNRSSFCVMAGVEPARPWPGGPNGKTASGPQRRQVNTR